MAPNNWMQERSEWTVTELLEAPKASHACDPNGVVNPCLFSLYKKLEMMEANNDTDLKLELTSK